ncbi:ATP-binding protein [Halobaculum sp. CBA1158]|uniref:sensor histidine kinase n=1 Tax=Halobaculum sp. CBA1158 TaxID=2904243 RepID=UPI001F3B950B|nr:ATP-binding protein [Halobaculum sp. CBA1158]UIO98774.1 ATP-binding protein [Halobaculum sp. CBA1158]
MTGDPGDDADETALADAVDSEAVAVSPAVLERMTDGFHVYDDEWRTTFLNEKARRIVSEAADVDLSTEEIVGSDIWELVPEAVGSEIHQRYHRAMETQESQEFETYYEPLGIWLEVRAFPSPSGLTVLFRDVTDEKRRVDQLEAREEILRAVTQALADPDLEFEGRVSELLRIGAGMLGTSYGTLSRVRDDQYVFEVVYAPDDSVAAGDVVDLSATNCERVVLSEESLAVADIGVDPDLSERAGYAEWGVSCYLGAPVRVNGSVYGTFCFYDDTPREEPFEEWQVTLVELLAEWVSSALERQVVEEDLRRQNDRLEQFAGIVSHDLRNPLAVAKGQSELAAEECDSEALEKAMRAHDRMERIISDVLTMARSGTAVESPESVDLSTVARKAWATVDTGDATLSAEDAPTVTADQSRLIQLLENLFRNAVEHGGPGVHVTVSSAPDGFAVADDGPGIPPGDRESVLEHGYSTREDGTGFGLSIVMEIAEAHGWSITVTESEAGGARFEFADGGSI